MKTAQLSTEGRRELNMKAIATGLLGIMLVIGNAAAQTVQEHAQILRDFETMVANYAHRERCLGHVLVAKAVTTPQIFTLPVAMVFRQLIAQALSEGAPTARMNAPVSPLPLAHHPVAMAPFPATELHDFPAALVNALPPLPPTLEYRLIGSDLVLRDAEADVIVAVLRDALGHVPTIRR